MVLAVVAALPSYILRSLLLGIEPTTDVKGEFDHFATEAPYLPLSKEELIKSWFNLVEK